MKARYLLAPLAATAFVIAIPLPAQAPAGTLGAPYHDASRAFLDLMVPHHDMGIMVAEHHLAMTRSDTVKALARRMIAAQRQEIGELKAVRRTLFGSDSSRSPMMRAMMQMMGMERMRDSSARRAMMDSMRMRQQPMAGGQRQPMQRQPMQRQPRQHRPMQHKGMKAMMSGDMDRMFLEHMIAHHEDGIDMSILAEDSQAAAQVKQLARKIREGQERDVAEMRRVLSSMPAAPADGHRH